MEGESPGDPRWTASVTTNNENNIAELRLGWDNISGHINGLEVAIAHELAHLHFWKQRCMVNDIVEEYVKDTSAIEIFEKLYLEHEERTVERMAWLAKEHADLQGVIKDAKKG